VVEGAEARAIRVATASATVRPLGAKPDRPLSGDPCPSNRLHPDMYAAEAAGTALLVVVGLSIVIAFWGKGAPLASLPIGMGERRLLNGFLVSCIGVAIAYSPLGKISGAHINPAITLAFLARGQTPLARRRMLRRSTAAGRRLGRGSLVLVVG
jgi:aquaporin Z